MGHNSTTARRQPGGGDRIGAGDAVSYRHSTPTRAARQGQQAPLGQVRAELRGELIYRGGRHVAALRGGELQRVYDAARELMRGSALCFHEDVLELAQAHGARWVVATERGSGQRYRVDLADFMARSWTYTHPTFGAQRGLDLARWERLPKEGEPVQLSLFAESSR